MNILGIYGAFDWDANRSFNDMGNLTWVHDSGATLFANGKHITSISEERLTRVKHEGNFPINSINYCLREGNILHEDVDLVYVPSMCIDIFYKRSYEGSIQNILKDIFPNAKVKFVSHHLCHASASVFSSDFNEGSFITLDGAGSLIFDHTFNPLMAETNSIGYFNKKKGVFRFFNGIPGSNNFGNFYHGLSHHIYCEKVNRRIDGNDEKYRETWDGKIMGLSAYGNVEMNDEHKLYSLSKELFYDDVPYVAFNENPHIAFRFKNADEKAYILQKNFENALLDYVTELKNNSYLDDNICFSGGSFLNVLGNSVLKQSNLFENIHIPPFPNDVGLHFGAACYAVFKNKESVELPTNISLLGKEYDNDEIEEILKEQNLTYDKYDKFEDLCEVVAKELNENKIVGWFQNKSEFGPRALGARSILMHPGPKENKDIINERVKHREYWRPFAGIILEEYLNEYFVEDFNSPYMLYSLTVKDDKVDEIGAVTHVDNTCRVQTVNNKYNHQVTMLLQKFKSISGLPILLNTSFNDNGEPIVESPFDSINSFMNMDIDFLAIGNFIVKK